MLSILFAVVIGLVVGFIIDRLKVGDDGIWHGPGEPPEGFVGFWDKGSVVVQWPHPHEDQIVVSKFNESNLVADSVIYSDLVVKDVSVDNITAKSITAEDIIPDPDFPGMLTTKQELEERRRNA